MSREYMIVATLDEICSLRKGAELKEIADTIGADKIKVSKGKYPERIREPNKISST